MGIPVVVLEGSSLSDALNLDDENKAKSMKPEEIQFKEVIAKEKCYRCPNSSEDLASICHLLLSVSL
jgi:hypothetical protein